VRDAAPASPAGNWPQFRGPTGDGRATARDLPLTWGETENVVWKTAIHHRGWSSPVIYGDQIWVTTSTLDGRELYALCIDRNTGEILKDMKVFDVAEPQIAHSFNSYASPTPVIEEGRIYVSYGSPGSACIDTEKFEVVWERRDIECNHFQGAGSSPILYHDLLILNFDGSDHQFVIALNKQTGETVWQTPRSIDFRDLGPDGKPKAHGDFRKAFSTPHVATIDGRTELISLGSKAAYSYDPLTGRELWRVEERGQHSASARPVVGEGTVFYPSGFGGSQLMAVRAGGNGVITDTHVAWRVNRGVPDKPSVLLSHGLIYMIDDGGAATCVDALNGDVVWQGRVGGNYSASPIHADGKIWFFSEEGKATAVRPGRTFQILAENYLNEGFMASAAVIGNAFYLRTKTHLYRIEQQ
jgi:outer membrane protein assembly factor BamB